MKRITIVTVNYNTATDTKKFLQSVYKVNATAFVIDTIVIDNGSSEKLVMQESKSVRLIRLPLNTGFTGGYNKGIQTALENGADYILIVNNDTILDPDILYNLKKSLELEPSIGVAVPKIYFAKGQEFHKDRYTKDELGKVIWYAGGYMDWDNIRSIHIGVDEVDSGQYDMEESTTFATGCCLLVKRKVFEKIGFFDTRYFLYYEDADFSVRVRKAGYTLRYVPKAFLYHVNASSSGGAGNTLQDYFITRNQMLFGMTYAPARAKIALFRQSVRLLLNGRPNQKKGIQDYYAKKFGKGSYL